MAKNKEVWKDIEGYEGFYQISNYGRVRSLDRYSTNYKGTILLRGKILSSWKHDTGYYRVGLTQKGKCKFYYIHRLVAQAFIPNPNNLPLINHKDENKTNNVVWLNEDDSIDYNKTNLEWCNNKYNCNYGTAINRRIETFKQNHKNHCYPCNKPILQLDLNDKLVREWKSIADIERELGFHRSNISKCCNKTEFNSRGYSCKNLTAYGYKWKFKNE